MAVDPAARWHHSHSAPTPLRDTREGGEKGSQSHHSIVQISYDPRVCMLRFVCVLSLCVFVCVWRVFTLFRSEDGVGLARL